MTQIIIDVTDKEPSETKKKAKSKNIVLDKATSEVIDVICDNVSEKEIDAICEALDKEQDEIITHTSDKKILQSTDILQIEEACSVESKFENYNLDSRILSALKNIGFSKPTEIQKQVLSIYEEGKDILAQSGTGSGKTLAFCLPILDDLLKNKTNKVLILAPTREIAAQVAELLFKLTESIAKSSDLSKSGGKNLRLQMALLIGGVPIDRQIDKLKKNPQILIATPGRVEDLIDRKRLNLGEVSCVILDEFDRMLDMGFSDAVRTIMKQCSPASKKYMFSATLTDKIKKDANEYLKNPAVVIVKNEGNTAINKNIKQTFEHCENYQHKKDKLLEALNQYKNQTILIFVNTKSETETLSDYLHNAGISGIDFIHGDLSQGARKNALKRFQDEKSKILISTDVLGRGVHIENVDLVLNYAPPKNIEDYIHRIGRTARGADKKGDSILFFGDNDSGFLDNLVKNCKVDIQEPKAKEVMASGFKGRSGGRGFSSRSGGFGERRSFGGRSSGGFGEKRSFGGERSSGGFGERRSFGGRSSGGFGEKRSFGGERSSGGFGERRSFGTGERSFSNSDIGATTAFPREDGARKSFNSSDKFSPKGSGFSKFGTDRFSKRPGGGSKFGQNKFSRKDY